MQGKKREERVRGHWNLRGRFTPARASGEDILGRAIDWNERVKFFGAGFRAAQSQARCRTRFVRRDSEGKELRKTKPQRAGREECGLKFFTLDGVGEVNQVK